MPPAAVTTNRGKEYSTTAAAGRPRRETAAVANTSVATPKKGEDDPLTRISSVTGIANF